MFFRHLAIKAPPIGQFPRNFAQTLIWQKKVKKKKKVCFSFDVILQMEIYRKRGCWPTPHNSAGFRENVDMRFNMWRYVGFMGQKCFCIENSATCWSFLMCELQGPLYCIVYGLFEWDRYKSCGLYNNPTEIIIAFIALATFQCRSHSIAPLWILFT